MKSLIILFSLVTVLPVTMYKIHPTNHSLLNKQETNCPRSQKKAYQWLHKFLTSDKDYFKNKREKLGTGNLSVKQISVFKKKENSAVYKQINKRIRKKFPNPDNYYNQVYFKSTKFYFVVSIYNPPKNSNNKKGGMHFNLDGLDAQIIILDKNSKKIEVVNFVGISDM
jgi:hypothetical protein